jgi:HSP20 family protein
MFDNLKDAGRTIGQEIGRAWDAVADGWRELFNRSSNALTHFSRAHDDLPPAGMPSLPNWSLLAGEVEESAGEIVVRLELPGMDKSDCQVRIDGHTLILRGNKRFERISEDSAFHVMERAYGVFERHIELPRNVRAEQAEASFHNGLLCVRLPKTDAGARARTITVR